MGKRRKNVMTTETCQVNVKSDNADQKKQNKNKKSKLNKKKKKCNAQLNICNQSEMGKTKKKEVSLNENSNVIDELINIEEEPSKIATQLKKSKSAQETVLKKHNSDKNVKLKSKKKFDNEEPQDTTTDINTQNVKKRKLIHDNDEADIRDEDIDEFCAELNNEDNKQFEEWVKLIEARLHGSTK